MFNILDIQKFFKVVGEHLGKGYSECVYQEAICVMLRNNAINYSTEVPLAIKFMGTTVGNVRADIVVEELDLIIECKAIEGNMKTAFIAQIINYMEITGYPNGLLINFNQNPSKDIIEIIIVNKKDNGYETLVGNKNIYFDKLGNQIEKEKCSLVSVDGKLVEHQNEI
jgi:GxxExxY protein